MGAYGLKVLNPEIVSAYIYCEQAVDLCKKNEKKKSTKMADRHLLLRCLILAESARHPQRSWGVHMRRSDSAGAGGWQDMLTSVYSRDTAVSAGSDTDSTGGLDKKRV